jgi:pantoate--beta-alanine ligase
MTLPLVVGTRAELAQVRDAMTGPVAVVMTMGALHAGHVELIRMAKARADMVIVTIFVNPLQFGPDEDLARYPRTFEADLARCTQESVDVVFAPTPEVMYPPGEAIERLSAGELGDRLEGAIRPGHFDGVLTVVAMLLKLTRADLAYFGEKDAQQLALIRQMVAEQQIPVELVGADIVREPDGLAMSSRNRFLDPQQRHDALALSRALRAGAAVASAGAETAVARTRADLVATPGVVVDYVEIVDEVSWAAPDEETRKARILVAGRVGATRLIDNVGVVLGTPPDSAG